MDILGLLLVLWVIGLLFPGGGGYGASLCEIGANIASAVIGCALLGSVLYAGGWCVYQAEAWVRPEPGGAIAALFVVALMVVPIIGLFAFLGLFAKAVRHIEGHP